MLEFSPLSGYSGVNISEIWLGNILIQVVYISISVCLPYHVLVCWHSLVCTIPMAGQYTGMNWKGESCKIDSYY